jgi:hypothetical protein
MKRLAGIVVILATVGAANATLIIDEDFTYSDGPLTTVAAGIWNLHSGTTGADISGGELLISGANSLDVNRVLDATYSSGILYYGLNIKLTAQPSATAAYFAHLLSGTSSFRDRLYSQASGSGYVLGINNGNTTTPTLWATELNLDTTYRVVVEANFDTDTTTLWINPIDMLSPNVSVSVASTVNPSAFAFRQATGIGNVVIDELQVGTTFADVIPEPATVGLLAGPGLGILVACMRRRRKDAAGD